MTDVIFSTANNQVIYMNIETYISKYTMVCKENYRKLEKMWIPDMENY